MLEEIPQFSTSHLVLPHSLGPVDPGLQNGHSPPHLSQMSAAGLAHGNSRDAKQAQFTTYWQAPNKINIIRADQNNIHDGLYTLPNT